MTEKNGFYRRQFLGKFAGIFGGLGRLVESPLATESGRFRWLRTRISHRKPVKARISLKRYRLRFFEAKPKTTAWKRCIKNYRTYLVFYFWEENKKNGGSL